MAIGPGIYDEFCTAVREHTGAAAVILIVIQGNRGGGFSCQAPLEIQFALPKILRTLAESIEIDLARPPQ